jgi:carboxymethylenebutenolidase
VHGGIGRREFIAGAGKFATAAVSAAALVEMLRPNYAWAIQVPEDDKRITAQTVSVPSPAGNSRIDGYLVRPSAARGKLPAILVIHENRGLNPYVKDVARRFATAGYIALAPDGLSSVGGYPGDDEKGGALFRTVDGAKMREDLHAAAVYLKTRPDSTGKMGAVGFCLAAAWWAIWRCAWAPTWRRACPSMARSPAPKTWPKSRPRSMPRWANWIPASMPDGLPLTRR